MRVGIIGVGSMGQNHARIISEVAELVGVVDADGSPVFVSYLGRAYV